jgi:hypothetical protein
VTDIGSLFTGDQARRSLGRDDERPARRIVECQDARSVEGSGKQLERRRLLSIDHAHIRPFFTISLRRYVPALSVVVVSIARIVHVI